jgi:hypothetical protein
LIYSHCSQSNQTAAAYKTASSLMKKTAGSLKFLKRTETRGFFDSDVVTSAWWVFAFVNNH